MPDYNYSIFTTKIVRDNLVAFHSSSKDHIFSLLRVYKQFVYKQFMTLPSLQGHSTGPLSPLLSSQTLSPFYRLL